MAGLRVARAPAGFQIRDGFDPPAGFAASGRLPGHPVGFGHQTGVELPDGFDPAGCLAEPHQPPRRAVPRERRVRGALPGAAGRAAAAAVRERGRPGHPRSAGRRAHGRRRPTCVTPQTIAAGGRHHRGAAHRISERRAGAPPHPGGRRRGEHPVPRRVGAAAGRLRDRRPPRRDRPRWTSQSTVRPDLVVLDIMLPDLDGFAVLERLRDAGIAGAGDLPDRARRHRRPRPRPDQRRRRLPGQAVRGGGAGRPVYGCASSSTGAGETSSCCAAPTWSWTRRPTG